MLVEKYDFAGLTFYYSVTGITVSILIIGFFVFLVLSLCKDTDCITRSESSTSAQVPNVLVHRGNSRIQPLSGNEAWPMEFLPPGLMAQLPKYSDVACPNLPPSFEEATSGDPQVQPPGQNQTAANSETNNNSNQSQANPSTTRRNSISSMPPNYSEIISQDNNQTGPPSRQNMNRSASFSSRLADIPSSSVDRNSPNNNNTSVGNNTQ